MLGPFRLPRRSLFGIYWVLASIASLTRQTDAFLTATSSRRYGHNLPIKTRPTNFAQKSPPESVLFGMWDDDGSIQEADRIKACIPYLLPLIDGDQFGTYIYERIPPLGALNEITIGPLSTLAHNIPFLTLGIFVALTLGTRFNTEMPRYLRFSAQQAALLDVALVVPQLIAASFEEDPVPRYIAEPCSNFVWYAYTSIAIYCIFSNLKGRKPDQIPYLSSSAELMVGPF